MWTNPSEKMPWAQMMTAENVSAVTSSVNMPPPGELNGGMTAAESWTRQQQQLQQPQIVGTPSSSAGGPWQTGGLLPETPVSWQERLVSAAADSHRAAEVVEADEALMWAPDMDDEME